MRLDYHKSMEKNLICIYFHNLQITSNVMIYEEYNLRKFENLCISRII